MGHPLAGIPTASLASLKAEVWVSTAAGDACDQLLHNACLAVGFRPPVQAGPRRVGSSSVMFCEPDANGWSAEGAGAWDSRRM
jgi:hypothetical protein